MAAKAKIKVRPTRKPDPLTPNMIAILNCARSGVRPMVRPVKGNAGAAAGGLTHAIKALQKRLLLNKLGGITLTGREALRAAGKK